MAPHSGSVTVAAVLVLAYVSLGCRHTAYRGDGTFEDRGWSWGSGRYRLDLGALDLAQPSVRHYKLAHLPEDPFAVGMEIVPPSPSERLDEGLPISPRVHIEMSSDDRQVIREDGQLAEWIVTTSGAGPGYAWCGGSDAAAWSREPGTQWGCRFTPLLGERYTLTVEVVEPDPRARAYTTTLIVEGGPPDFLP